MKNYFIIGLVLLTLSSCGAPLHVLSGSQLFIDTGVDYNAPINDYMQNYNIRDIQPYARVNYRIYVFDTKNKKQKK